MVFKEAHMVQPNHSKANDTQQEQRVQKKPETFHVVKTGEQKSSPRPEIKLAGNLAFQETWIAPPATERPSLELAPASETKELSEKQIIERARELDTSLDVDLLREHLRKGDTEKQWFTRIRIAAEQELRGGELESQPKVIRDRKDCRDQKKELLQELQQLLQSKEPSDSEAKRITTLFALLIDAQSPRNDVRVMRVRTLAKDDFVPAVFKPKNGEAIWIEENGKKRGILENRQQGGYLREWLAGFLAKAIGSQVVPPTVIREIDGAIGSVQGWVEGTQAAYCRGKKPGDKIWTEIAKENDLQELAVLDYLLQNADRHEENFFIEADGSVKGIDHGLTLPAPNHETALHSYPLRYFSNKKAELLPDLRERLARTFNNGSREDLIRDAFYFIFGEKDGKIFFDQLIKRVNELTGSGRFPEYQMVRASDEKLFAEIASTTIEGKPKKIVFDTSKNKF